MMFSLSPSRMKSYGIFFSIFFGLWRVDKLNWWGQHGITNTQYCNANLTKKTNSAKDTMSTYGSQRSSQLFSLMCYI